VSAGFNRPALAPIPSHAAAAQLSPSYAHRRATREQRPQYDDARDTRDGGGRGGRSPSPCFDLHSVAESMRRAGAGRPAWELPSVRRLMEPTGPQGLEGLRAARQQCPYHLTPGSGASGYGSDGGDARRARSGRAGCADEAGSVASDAGTYGETVVEARPWDPGPYIIQGQHAGAAMPSPLLHTHLRSAPAAGRQQQQQQQQRRQLEEERCRAREPWQQVGPANSGARQGGQPRQSSSGSSGDADYDPLAPSCSGESTSTGGVRMAAARRRAPMARALGTAAAKSPPSGGARRVGSAAGARGEAGSGGRTVGRQNAGEPVFSLALWEYVG
jgi:hypothetical protein